MLHASHGNLLLKIVLGLVLRDKLVDNRRLCTSLEKVEFGIAAVDEDLGERDVDLNEVTARLNWLVPIVNGELYRGGVRLGEHVVGCR